MITKYHPNGAIKSTKIRNADGALHNTDGPAAQRWNENRVLIAEAWYFDGLAHREDGPARRRWNDNGALTFEVWCVEHRIHRFGGPAIRQWARGKLTREEWAVYGQPHRVGNPAIQRWVGGALTYEGWFQNGAELTREAIAQILQPADVMATLRELPHPIFEEVAEYYRVR